MTRRTGSLGASGNAWRPSNTCDGWPMAKQQLAQDFKEFLALLNSASVEYLIVGGYAVASHGYPRPTGDLDIWVAVHPDTAARLAKVCHAF